MRASLGEGPASDLSCGEGEDAIVIGVLRDDDGSGSFELDDVGGGRVSIEPEPIGVGVGEVSPGEDEPRWDGDGATA